MLTLTVQDQPDGIALPDLTARLTRATFSTNLHGDEALSVSAPLSLSASFQRYDRAGLPHAIITDGAARPFQGRVEDTAIQGNGFTMTALGYSRAMSDERYTALWSDASVTRWRVLTTSDNTGSPSEKYESDTSNRIYLAARKGESYNNTFLGLMGYVTPSGGTRQIVGISFDYVFLGPTVDWQFLAQRRDAAWATVGTDLTVNGGGGPVVGTRNLTFAGTDNYTFGLYYNAAAAVFAGETGTCYFRVFNIRLVTSTTNRVNTTHTVARGAGVNVTATVGSTANMYVGGRLDIGATGATIGESVIVKQILSATQFVADFTAAAAIGLPVAAHVIYADEIVRDLISVTSALNPTQLQSDTALVASPARDLFNEIYADQLPSAIIDRLVGLGDNQTPPNIWEWGVTGSRQLYYRIAGSVGLTWYVDVTAIDVQRSLEQFSNSVYAVYRDPSGGALRGAASTDAASVDRAGVTRRTSVDADTTSLVQANVQRDAALTDRADPPPRFGITFTAIYNSVGGRVPLWQPRAGDTIVIRNLPPTVSPNLDQVRSFRIARTTCDLIARTLTVEPLTPLPSLAALLARSLRGQTT